MISYVPVDLRHLKPIARDYSKAKKVMPHFEKLPANIQIPFGMKKTFILKIYRGVPEKQYWEEFELELKPYFNITAALMDIQKNPINRKKEKVTPCRLGTGLPRRSVRLMLDADQWAAAPRLHSVDPAILEATGSNTVTIAPMTKFPLVKDLVVNRDIMFENLKRIKGWIETDDALDRGFGPKISPKVQEAMYVLSTCMTCGCCSEACPQINSHSKFIGPAAISQVRLFNSHPVGKLVEGDRLRPMMEEGGVSDCGNAQNCRRGLPQNHSADRVHSLNWAQCRQTSAQRNGRPAGL